MLRKFSLLGAALLCIAPLFAQMAPSAPAAKGTPADEKAIQAVLDTFLDAWNKHNANLFASVFAEDADFTNVVGQSAHGRAAIEAFHAPLFASAFKDSNQTFSSVRIRMVRPDVAAVDAEWRMTGATSRDGRPIPVRRGLLNFTMTKEGGAWQILVMHNMNLPPGPSG